MRKPLRIAILAHSTNPRGGVVHALELGDALARLGHYATVFAPATEGAGFFRHTVCDTICVPASPVGRDVRRMVEIRAADYVAYFERAEHRGFDVWHAQDGISANALATLKARRLIAGFARTVHHVDAFADPKLSALQRRSIVAADHLFVVGKVWRSWLAREFEIEAHYVGNGVDLMRFSPVPDAADAELRGRLDVPTGVPVFLSIGGIEERKNTVRILQAFQQLRSQHTRARLVIAGGASLLDHDAYQRRFRNAIANCGRLADDVIFTGPLPQEMMAPLYRAASALVFPSTSEGFGLAVLEAMASGLPVVTSHIPPFTEYLDEEDVAWCDPFDVGSIAEAMTSTLDPSRRSKLVGRGFAAAARRDWATTAHAHLGVYAKLAEPVHA
jgi:glycosyltransferase-like protein